MIAKKTHAYRTSLLWNANGGEGTTSYRSYSRNFVISSGDKPAIEMNKDKMAQFLPELKKYYYDPSKYKTYLDQLGIKYPTVKQ